MREFDVYKFNHISMHISFHESYIQYLVVEVGMDPTWFMSGPARCPLRGPRVCHGQEILFQALIDTSLCAESSFSLFFSLKLSKIQKNNIKHGPGSRARGPGPGRGQNLEISSPTHHFLKLAGDPVNRPDPIHAQVYLVIYSKLKI